MTTSASTPGTTTPPPMSATPSVSVQIDQGRARRLLDRALTLSQRGDRPAAIVACRQAVSLAPQEASGYSILGMLLEQAGDTPGAITAYETVINQTDDCEAERESVERLYVIRRQSQSAKSMVTESIVTESQAVTSDLGTNPIVPHLRLVTEQNTLQPELPALTALTPTALGAPLELAPRRHSTFHTRVLPLLIVSAASLVAIVWTKRVAQPPAAQTPSTIPVERSVSAPALSAPQNPATGTTTFAQGSAPGNVATGSATTSTAKTGRPSLSAPAAGVRVRGANASVRAPRRSSSSAPRYDQSIRGSAGSATQYAAQPAQSPGTGVATASSPPHSVATGSLGATDVHDGAASPNGKPFNPNGSESNGYIRINPYEAAAQ